MDRRGAVSMRPRSAGWRVRGATKLNTQDGRTRLCSVEGLCGGRRGRSAGAGEASVPVKGDWPDVN